MRYLETFNRWLNERLAWLGGLTLVLMMLLSVLNMVLRGARHPFAGTAEVVGWLSALTTAFALGYTQLYRGHVAIDVVVTRLPQRAQAVLDFLVSLASAVLFALAAWRTGVYAAHSLARGSLSETMQIIYYPFTYAVSFGLACLALALIVDGLKSLGGAIKK